MNLYPLSPELLPRVGDERPLRILVGWDQSGEEAVHFAGWLAASTPAKVRVVTTASRPWSSWGSKSKKYKKWRKKLTDERTADIRSCLKEHVPRHAWDSDFAVFAEGPSRHELLIDEAQRYHADIIILGSKAKAGKGHFRATSTAESLMHNSPVALGLAPRGVKLSKKGINRVNFAFLDERDEATNYGIKLATAMAMVLDVSLRIFAFSPRTSCKYDSKLDKNGALIDEWNETSLALLDRSRDAVSDMADKLKVKNLKHFEVETLVSSGDGWGDAVASHKWKKGDVLCLGSRPSGRRRVFAGARAADFLKHVSVPVVIFPQR